MIYKWKKYMNLIKFQFSKCVNINTFVFLIIRSLFYLLFKNRKKINLNPIGKGHEHHSLTNLYCTLHMLLLWEKWLMWMLRRSTPSVCVPYIEFEIIVNYCEFCVTSRSHQQIDRKMARKLQQTRDDCNSIKLET